jgi:hypothetical protein
MSLGKYRRTEHIEQILFKRLYLGLVEMQFLGYLRDRNIVFTTRVCQPLSRQRSGRVIIHLG